MSTATSSPVVPAANAQSNAKAARAKYGTSGQPIPGVIAAFKKPLSHDFGGKKGESWVLLTKNSLIRATTYDGNLGERFNLGEHNTTTPAPAADSKDLKRATKGYASVPVTACPVAAPAAK